MKKWTLALIAILSSALGIMHLSAQTRGAQAARSGAPPSPPAEVCREYEPSLVQLVEDGVGGWRIVSERESIMGMATRADADIILSVFKAHKTFCWVGSDNTRPNRAAYVHEIWKSPLPVASRASGASSTPARENCTPYDPALLKLTNEGADGWLISRGEDGARFVVMDTKADADIMMGVFKAHKSICYVGRDNTQPNRERLIHEYWK